MFTSIRPDMESIPKEFWVADARIASQVVVEAPLAEKWIDETVKNMGEEMVRIGCEQSYKLIIEETDALHFDAGGMCAKDEPVFEIVVDDMKFVCMHIHADLFVASLGNVRENGWLGKHIWLGGRWWAGVLTVKTAARVLEEFAKIQPEIQAKAESRNQDIRATLERANQPQEELGQ